MLKRKVIKNINKNIHGAKVYELCPFCENEVELKAEVKIQKCPSCNMDIKPCSLCIECITPCIFD